MSSPSREHLLGYLLGALERTEQEQVEAELEANPALRAELRRLEDCLGRVGLAGEADQFDPPADLAARTCRLVASRRGQVVVASRSWTTSGMHAERQMTWVNVLTVVSVLVAAAALFFPALNHSLIQAERAACQNNMRQISLALQQYSELEPSGSVPRVERAGNRGVAGIYAPILASKQLIQDPAVFHCPAVEGSRNVRSRKLHTPTLEEIDKAEGDLLAWMQATMGGDFGYILGYTHNGELVAPCNSRRPDYVLLSDAPSDKHPGRLSLNHAGRGQNVLYEDGHIKFIPTFPSPLLRDDPFYNLQRRVAAGLNCDDHVLGASSDRP
jgi:hypothetical protein